jgi:hypothetical protein
MSAVQAPVRLGQRGKNLRGGIADPDPVDWQTVDLSGDNGPRQLVREVACLPDLADKSARESAASQRVGADTERSKNIDDDDCTRRGRCALNTARVPYLHPCQSNMRPRRSPPGDENAHGSVSRYNWGISSSVSVTNVWAKPS